MSNAVLRLILIIPALIGVYFAALGVHRHMESIDKASWQEVEAKVLRAEVQNLQSKAKTRAKIRAVRLFKPVVVLGYEVSGKEFRFETSGSGLRKREAALQVLSGFKVGSSRELFYSPQNPEKASLKQEGPLVSIVLYAIGLFFVGLSFFLFKMVSKVKS